MPDLPVERDAEQQSGERAEEEEDHRDATEVGAVAEQSRLDQRAASMAALVAQEGERQHHARGEDGEEPERPAVFLALDERAETRFQRIISSEAIPLRERVRMAAMIGVVTEVFVESAAAFEYQEAGMSSAGERG